MFPHCWNHKTSSTKRLNNCTCQTEKNMSPGIMQLWRQIKCVKEREGERKENAWYVCILKRKLPTKIKILSFVYFDEIGFEEQIVKYLPNLVHTPVRLSFFFLGYIVVVFSHLTKVIWMSLVGITSSALGPWRQGACVCLSVVAGHGSLGDCSSLRVRDSHFGYVHIHSRSMASSKLRYFRRSNTQTYNENKKYYIHIGINTYPYPLLAAQRKLVLTEPSDALAPTLSPAAFQQTSKMPPVPL